MVEGKRKKPDEVHGNPTIGHSERPFHCLADMSGVLVGSCGWMEGTGGRLVNNANG